MIDGLGCEGELRDFVLSFDGHARFKMPLSKRLNMTFEGFQAVC